MYHTRNTLGNHPSTKPTLGHVSAYPQAMPGSPPAIGSIRSTSTTWDEDMSISNQSSGSEPFFRRKRSTESKKECSKARAQDLSKLLELSENRDVNLNRNGSFPKEVKLAPRMGGGGMVMNLKQAEAFGKKKNQEEMSKHQNNTLLSDHEIKEQQRKAYDELIRKSTGGKLYEVPNLC